MRQAMTETAYRRYLCVGIGCFMAVFDMVLWGGLPWSNALHISFLDILQLKTVPESLAIGVAIFFAFRVTPARPWSRKIVVSYLAAFLLVIVLTCLILFFVGDVPPSTGVLPVVGTSFLLGLTCGASFYAWGLLLGDLDERTGARTILFALMLAGMLLVVTSLAPLVLRILVFVALGGTATVLFAVCTLRMPTNMHVLPDSTSESTGIHARKIPWPLLFCLAAIAFALAMMRTTALMGMDRKDGANVVGGLCILAGAVCLYLYWFRSGHKDAGRRIDTLSLYLIVFPVIATLSVLIPVLGGTAALVVASLLFALFVIMTGLMVTTSLNLSQHVEAGFPTLFGLFDSFIFLAMGVATQVAHLLYRNLELDSTTISLCALMVLYVLAMAYVILQRRRRGKDRFGIDDESSTGSAPMSSAISEELCRRAGLLAQDHHLTERETEVLRLLASGNSIRGIAAKLFVSENTVRTHLKSLYRKLDVHAKQEVLDLLDAYAQR